MDHDAAVAAVERELTRFTTALAAGTPEASVPTCPEFSLDDLAVHVGDLAAFWAHVLADGAGRAKAEIAPGSAVDPADRVAWLQQGAEMLVTELRATPSDTEVWTWFPDDQTARFVARRCAHEFAVHRVDAELASGGAGPIEPDVAADGIEEALLFASARVDQDPTLLPEEPGTIHLHGTDHGEAEWLLSLSPDGLTVRREHAKGDLALRGTVGDLELLLYQRPPSGTVERFGDEDLLGAFHRVFTF